MARRISDKKISHKSIAQAIAAHQSEYRYMERFYPEEDQCWENFDAKEFGKNVRLRRESLSITQVKCAKHAGMTRTMLSKIENGQVNLIRQEYRYLLCIVLQSNPGYLCGQTSSPEMDFEMQPDGTKIELRNPFVPISDTAGKLSSEVLGSLFIPAFERMNTDFPEIARELLAILQSRNPDLENEFHKELSRLCAKYDLPVEQNIKF